MFGYACDETSTLMPMPISLAQRMAEQPGRGAQGRHHALPAPRRQDPGLGPLTSMTSPLTWKRSWFPRSIPRRSPPSSCAPRSIGQRHPPRLEREGRGEHHAGIHINPTGRFVIGGPQADSGLTGRKIIVDTYGGSAPHGGGAFSGKDPTKVDRSAAYAARWVAKNVVAAGFAHRCARCRWLTLSAWLSPLCPSWWTPSAPACVPVADIERAIGEVFDLRPGAIIDALDLRRPIYRLLAAYGHFGRELPEFTWEKTDRADALRKACGLE